MNIENYAGQILDPETEAQVLAIREALDEIENCRWFSYSDLAYEALTEAYTWLEIKEDKLLS